MNKNLRNFRFKIFAFTMEILLNLVCIAVFLFVVALTNELLNSNKQLYTKEYNLPLLCEYKAQRGLVDQL